MAKLKKEKRRAAERKNFSMSKESLSKRKNNILFSCSNERLFRSSPRLSVREKYGSCIQEAFSKCAFKCEDSLRLASDAYLVTHSCLTLGNPMDCSPLAPLSSWDFPGKETGLDCNSLLQVDLPDPGTEPASPASASSILYHLGHLGSPLRSDKAAVTINASPSA